MLPRASAHTLRKTGATSLHVRVVTSLYQCAYISVCSHVLYRAHLAKAEEISVLSSGHQRAFSVASAGALPSIPPSMRAVEAVEGKCRIATRPVPVPGPEEALIRIHYSAVNRADTLQRKGQYPPPKGCTDVLGLEMSGEIVATGGGKQHYNVGDRVMALLAGGGNAEYATVRSDHLMPIPASMSFAQAAALPETWLTAYQLLFRVGNVKPNSAVLIHAAASGVGTAAIQLAVDAGVKVIAVAGSDEKLAAVQGLGASIGINYKKTANFSTTVLQNTGAGVQTILDPVGGSFWRQNLESLAMDGTWVLYGTMGGGSVEGGLLAGLLRKRGKLVATTLRNRSDAYKADLVSDFVTSALPKFEAGRLRTIVDREFDLSQIAEAHEYMESNANIGKIVLRVTSEDTT